MRKYTYMEIWNCKKPTLFSLLVNTSFGNLRLTSFQSSRSGKDECLPPSILPANQDGALGTWDHPSTILSRRMGYEDTPVSVQLWHGMDRQFLKENKTGGHSKMTAIYCTFTPALPLSLLDHKAHHDYPGQAASLLFLDRSCLYARPPRPHTPSPHSYSPTHADTDPAAPGPPLLEHQPPEGSIPVGPVHCCLFNACYSARHTPGAQETFSL